VFYVLFPFLVYFASNRGGCSARPPHSSCSSTAVRVFILDAANRSGAVHDLREPFNQAFLSWRRGHRILVPAGVAGRRAAPVALV